jgi:phosphoribosyl-ATP pyrophosphohydrolase
VTEQIVSAMTGSSIELSGYAKVEDVKDYVRSGVTDSKTYTNNKIKELSNVYASKSTVDSLIGKDTNKTIRKVAAEEVAKIVASADTKYDTLKEISDWIINDTTGAAAMANDIAALKKETHTHTNKSVIDSITPEKIAAWESAVEKINSLENIINSLIKEYIINNVKGKEYEISINYSDDDKKHTISFDNNAIFGIIPE